MKKKAGVILFLKGCRLAISILNLYLSAVYFGVSIERDTWLLAINAFIIFDMAIWGPINETFRAKFVFLREESGEDEALRQTRSLFLFTNGITLVIVIFTLWKPELISSVIAPTYKGEQLALLVFMIRVIAPTFLFNQVTQLLTGMLNAYNSVYVPEIAGFISAIINLILILVLAPKIGILSLVYAYYVSLLILLTLLLFQIRVRKIRLFSNFKGSKLIDAWPFILFSLPFFLPYFVGQVALVIEKSIASTLGLGVVSTLDYARKFSDIVISVLLSVLLTVFLPILSVHFMKNNVKAFIFELRQIFQLGFLIITSFIAILTACPQAVVNILYQNGKISASALEQISNLATYYSWCAAAIFFYNIFGVALLSAKKQKYYAFYGMIAQLIMIVFNLLLYKKLGIYVFPLTFFLSHAFAAFFMFRKLPYGKDEILVVVMKYAAVLLAVVVLMYLLNAYLIFFSSAYVVLAINIFVLATILFAILFFFRLDEHLVLVNIYKKVFNRQKE